MDDLSHYMLRVSELRGENERLREALQKVGDYKHPDYVQDGGTLRKQSPGRLLMAEDSTHEGDVTWINAKAAKGPPLAAWIEQNVEIQSWPPSVARRLSDWKRGERTFFSVDKGLTKWVSILRNFLTRCGPDGELWDRASG